MVRTKHHGKFILISAYFKVHVTAVIDTFSNYTHTQQYDQKPTYIF